MKTKNIIGYTESARPVWLNLGSTLFIIGEPGSGKTELMESIIDDIVLCNDPDTYDIVTVSMKICDIGKVHDNHTFSYNYMKEDLTNDKTEVFEKLEDICNNADPNKHTFIFIDRIDCFNKCTPGISEYIERMVRAANSANNIHLIMSVQYESDLKHFDVIPEDIIELHIGDVIVDRYWAEYKGEVFRPAYNNDESKHKFWQKYFNGDIELPACRMDVFGTIHSFIPKMEDIT